MNHDDRLNEHSTVPEIIGWVERFLGSYSAYAIMLDPEIIPPDIISAHKAKRDPRTQLPHGMKPGTQLPAKMEKGLLYLLFCYEMVDCWLFTASRKKHQAVADVIKSLATNLSNFFSQKNTDIDLDSLTKDMARIRESPDQSQINEKYKGCLAKNENRLRVIRHILKDMNPDMPMFFADNDGLLFESVPG